MSSHSRVRDPLEEIIAHALDKAGIDYATDYEGKSPAELDFHLPALDLYIEVKSGHSDRIATQTTRHHNIIVVQGVKATKWVAELISRSSITNEHPNHQTESPPQ